MSIASPNLSTWNSAVFVAFPQYNIPPNQACMVAFVKDPYQIQRVLQCAWRYNLSVAAKGGGHNYAGYSQPPHGIQINLQRYMTNISLVKYKGIDAIKVGAGATFGNVYKWLNTTAPQFLLAGGLCPSVGIAGFHLGGGLGALCRQYGMGVDNVLSLTVVTVNGSKIVTANEDENSDLFWALRGGGGPSFGVVTDFTIRVHPSFPSYSYGEFCVGSDKNKIRANLLILKEITTGSDFPDWLTVDWRLVKRNSNFTGLCYLIYSLRGKNETEEALLRLTENPTNKRVLLAEEAPPSGIPGWNFLQSFDDFLNMELSNAAYKAYAKVFEYPVINRHWILPTLNESLIDILIESYDRMPDVAQGGPSCYIQGLALGGSRISSVDSNATAFPFRQNVSYAADTECDQTSEEEKEIIDEFQWFYINATKPYKLGAFLNFPYREIEDYAENYWGEALPRLIEVRKRWNPYPHSPLSFPQEVPLV